MGPFATVLFQRCTLPRGPELLGAGGGSRLNIYTSSVLRPGKAQGLCKALRQGESSPEHFTEERVCVLITPISVVFFLSHSPLSHIVIHLSTCTKAIVAYCESTKGSKRDSCYAQYLQVPQRRASARTTTQLPEV